MLYNSKKGLCIHYDLGWRSGSDFALNMAPSVLVCWMAVCKKKIVFLFIYLSLSVMICHPILRGARE